MNPTPPTPPPAEPPAAGGGLVEYVRGNRGNAGLVLLGLAGLLVALAGFLGYKAFGGPAPKPADQPLDQKADPARPDPKPPAETAAQVAARNQFNIGWVLCLAAAASAAAAGAWLAARPAPPAEAEQRTEARVVLLTVGAALGGLLILAGLAYFYLWSQSLTDWLNRGEVAASKWVVYPLLMVIAGAGLVFLGIQPARAEERHSQAVRKAVYGANAALTVLLLLVVLVVANVAFALKVPAKLDTTATGFFSISDATKGLLGRLGEPVYATAVIPDQGIRDAADIRQLLLACEDASAGKFRVRFLSDVADRTELSALMRNYPALNAVLNRQMTTEEEQDGAVLLTAGDPSAPGLRRSAVIPAREFVSRGEEGRRVFSGEDRLFKEVAFLADEQNRPVVYFTQGSGELAVEAAPGGAADRSAGRLKKYLEDNYVTVRPVDLAGGDPAVPPDAAVVVVADPLTPVRPAGLAALRKYAGERRGKLIVLLGSHPGVERKMAPTGLDPLFADLGVRVGDKFVFTLDPQNRIIPGAVASFAPAAAQNKVLQALVRTAPLVALPRAREVGPAAPGGGPGPQATVLMTAALDSWVEDEDPADLLTAAREVATNPRVAAAKGFGADRPVAAMVSDGPTPRAVVVGGADFVSDAGAGRSRAPIGFDLVGVSVDWLRDKETSIAAAGIEAKKYGAYKFPPPAAVDDTRLKYLPLGLALLAVVGLGTGVWVARRK